MPETRSIAPPIAPPIAMQVATVCGIGYLKPGPGTWASIAAGIVALIVIPYIPTNYVTSGLLGLVAVATCASLWLVPKTIAHFGRSDPSQVVVDEVVGVWLGVALIPSHILQTDTVISVLLVVVLFRVFDIAKPWPVNWFERLPGAHGIMADDMVAGLAAGLMAAALLH